MGKISIFVISTLTISSMAFAALIPAVPNNKYGTGDASALSDSTLTQDPNNIHVYINGDAAQVIYDALEGPEKLDPRYRTGDATQVFLRSGAAASCVKSIESSLSSTQCTLRINKK